jgi:acyl-CoA synthetase (AMP-forming)/AMP-acid ligase II
MPALVSQSKTLIDLLEHNRAEFPSRPALRLARPNCSPTNLEWDDISYRQLFDDVQAMARYWSNKFMPTSISLIPGDVITLWLPGTGYGDLLHLMAFMTLGVTVQMISHQPMPEQVLHLVKETSSKFLIASSSFLSPERASQLPIPLFQPVAVTDVPKSTTPMPHVAQQGSDIGFILHTSGTTSGRPKAVPITHDWMMFATKNFTAEDSDDGEIVRYWQSNIAHVGTIISKWLFLPSIIFHVIKRLFLISAQRLFATRRLLSAIAQLSPTRR